MVGMENLWLRQSVVSCAWMLQAWSPIKCSWSLPGLHDCDPICDGTPALTGGKSGLERKSRSRGEAIAHNILLPLHSEAFLDIIKTKVREYKRQRV